MNIIYLEFLFEKLKYSFLDPVCKYENITFLVIDECHLIVSWGMKKGDKVAFRPAMSLTSGELSGIGGKMLFMTATASAKTVRILMDQLPEVKRWILIFK